MSTYLISKLDLPDYVQFSTQTADNLINPYIQDAWLFDVQPALLEEEQQVLSRVKKLTPEALTDLADLAKLSDADVVLLPSEQQIALAEYKLFMGVRGWFCLEAYRRVFTYHGCHMTNRGFEFFSGEGSQPVPSQQRNEIKQDILDKRNHYRTLFDKALSAYRGPAPASNTCGPRRTKWRGKGGFQLHAV